LVGEGSPTGEREPLPELFSPKRWSALARQLGLTPRQTDVARLICRAMTASEIAKELRLSESAVRLHTDALYKRLHVRRRVSAVVRILLAGRCQRCRTTAGV
jgi:DNA-binding NarL/FixJ family response regulator